MDDGLFVVVFVRWSSASPDGAADAVFPEVVFITFLDAATAVAIQNCAEFCITLSFAACCWTACASSPPRSALGKPSSLVRRGKLPMASVARVALAKHAAKQPSVGEAKPRLTSPASAVVVLAGVETMSATCLLCVARCVRCCDCRVVKPSATSGHWTMYRPRSSSSWEAVLHPCRARNGLRATYEF